jgi:hypothetical protein
MDTPAGAKARWELSAVYVCCTLLMKNRPESVYHRSVTILEHFSENIMNHNTKHLYARLIIAILALLNLANSGTVVSLSASGGGEFNQTITIHTTINALEKVQTSNLYFEIRAPDGTVVATHETSPPSLEAGDSYSYNWSSNNSSYPSIGDYSVVLCWSPGNSRNCQIPGGAVTTTFFSVPTFGEVLTIVALVLVAVWFWRVRRRLSNSPEANL